MNIDEAVKLVRGGHVVEITVAIDGLPARVYRVESQRGLIRIDVREPESELVELEEARRDS